MASSMLQQLQERQSSLLHALVQNLFSFKTGDPNYVTTRDYCRHHLKHHKFPSTQPSEVDKLYAGLEERLLEHAQYSKARVLNHARQQLCQLGLQGVEPDLDWSILSMLFSLAHRPLDTECPPQGQIATGFYHSGPHSAYGAGYDAPGYGPQGQVHGGQQSHEHDGSTSSDVGAHETWDSASDLSDWSQDGSDTDMAGAPAAAATTGQQGGSTGSLQATEDRRAKASGRFGPLGATTWSRMAASITSAAQTSDLGVGGSAAASSIGPPRAATCPADSLAACLAQTRLGSRLPLAGLSPTDCCSDGYLVHQCLALMLGSSSKLFVWQERLGRYTPRKGLHVPYLSTSQLQGVLGKVAETGTQVRHLLSLTRLAPGDAILQLPPTMCSVGFHSPRLSGRKSVLATPCVRAYVSALHVQLQRLTQALTALQQGSMVDDVEDPSVARPGQAEGLRSSPTLLELLDLTSPAARRIQLLYLSALAVMTALPGGPTAGTDSPRPTASSAGGASDSAGSTPSPRGTLSAAAARAAARVASRSKLGIPASAEAGAKEGPVSAGGGEPAPARPPSVAPLQLEAAGAVLGSGQAQGTQGASEPGAASAAAQTSAVLLDVLHRQLQQLGPLGSPSHRSDHQVVLHLFLCTMVPVLEALHCWLYGSDSQEDNLPSDFFIRVTDRSMSETDPAYWSSAHALVMREVPQQSGDGMERASSLGGQNQKTAAMLDRSHSVGSQELGKEAAPTPACPSFLQPLAKSILAAGKSLRLLRSSERPGAGGRTKSRHTWPHAARPPLGSPLKAYAAAVDQFQDIHKERGHGHGQGGADCNLLQAFLDSVQAQLAQPGAVPGLPSHISKPARQLHNAAGRDAGDAAAVPAALQQAGCRDDATPGSSLFSLMAAAGRGMSQLEPWRGPSHSLDVGRAGPNPTSTSSVPPPPSLPWLPSWTLPANTSLPAALGQDISSRHVTHQLGSSGSTWDGSQGSGSEVAAPQTPPRQVPDQDRGSTEGDSEGRGPVAPPEACDGGAQRAMAMDVSAPPTPAPEQQGPASSSPHDQERTAARTQAGRWQLEDMEAEAVVCPPANAQSDECAGVAGLEAWHGAMSQGMMRWQHRLQHGNMMTAWASSSHSSRSTGMDAAAQQLRAALLPTLVQPSWNTHRALTQRQRQRPGTQAQAQVQAVALASGWASTAASAQQQALQRLGWLLEGCSDAGDEQQLPPIELLLERSLLPLLHNRVEDINQQLLGCMLSNWGLMAELVQLRNFYLLASPAMQAWASWLLSSLLRGKMVEEYQEHELEAALQEAMASCTDGDAPLPPLDCVSVTIDHKRAARARDRQVEASRRTTASFSTAPQPQSSGGAHPSERKQNHCLAELDGLQLRCQPTWLMSMIGGTHAMESYGHAMVFLLQIQLAKLALENARQRSWKLMQHHVRQQRGSGAHGHSSAFGVLDVMYSQPAVAQGRPGSRPGTDGGLGASSATLLGQKAEEAMQQEMVNFVNNLHQFVLDRLLLNAWVQLERSLDTAHSLDEVVALHKRFVAELDQQCGRGGVAGGTQKHVWAAIIRVLDQVVRFCSSHKNAAEAAEALTETAGSTGGPAGSAASAAAATSQGGAPRRGGLATRSQLQLQEQLGTARKVMADAAAQFSQLLAYLLRILHAATLKARSRTEFEQLLTRINHNGYYDPLIQVVE